MIILASQSPTRQKLLSLAGVVFSVRDHGYDETQGLMDFEPTPGQHLALYLATEKARPISVSSPADVIIGADQTLHCERQQFHKPGTRDAARAQLLSLRGKTHTLTTAATCLFGGQSIWHHVAQAQMTMRNFSNAALDDYLDNSAGEILGAVGSYHYEGTGTRLMESVSGDYHTILGLPVLPLLRFLRSAGYLPT